MLPPDRSLPQATRLFQNLFAPARDAEEKIRGENCEILTLMLLGAESGEEHVAQLFLLGGEVTPVRRVMAGHQRDAFAYRYADMFQC